MVLRLLVPLPVIGPVHPIRPPQPGVGLAILGVEGNGVLKVLAGLGSGLVGEAIKALRPAQERIISLKPLRPSPEGNPLLPQRQLSLQGPDNPPRQLILDGKNIP